MTKAEFLRDATLADFQTKIGHGFFTRKGGVSSGIYSSLNCGLGTEDAPESVAENRSRVAGALGGCEKLFTLNQVHSNQCLIIQNINEIPPREAAKMDAIATNIPNLAIGILTADCAPILFFDPKRRVIGAAHAGWRGAMNGVLESTVAAMEKLGSNRTNIVATVGPCIGQESYEVAADYYQKFIAENPLNKVYFAASPKSGHHHFDLRGYVLGRLLAARIGHVGSIAEDTYKNGNSFFSYRRTTHRGEADYGRQISAIALKS